MYVQLGPRRSSCTVHSLNIGRGALNTTVQVHGTPRSTKADQRFLLVLAKCGIIRFQACLNLAKAVLHAIFPPPPLFKPLERWVRVRRSRPEAWSLWPHLALALLPAQSGSRLAELCYL